ncbi:L,D-transpeptidase [Olsenella profusa]|uniref:L,D-transpeptidase n=2 Tax=Olsenella profusa TaxID=138595 RepID=A0ABS2F1C5_9ACTN|nr:L,D-transpeptidase [Olsenella profusa]
MQQTSKKASPARRRRRRLWIIPVVILALLAVAYAGGVVTFSSFVFMPGTTLDSSDVSWRTVDDVAAEKSASLGDFESRVTGDGIDLNVKGSEVGLACDGESYARSAIAQVNAWAWPYELTQRRTISAEAGVSLDEDALSTLVQQAVDAVKQANADAGSGISYDAEQAQFVLDKGAIANHLDAAAVTEHVSEGLRQRQESIELGDECLDVADSLTSALDTANSYLAGTVTLNLGGQHAYDVTAEQIAGWVTIGDDFSVSLDTAAIDDWGHGELSQMFDTVGTERTYTRPDGATFTVNDGDAQYGRSTYGWIIDGGAAAQQVAAAIQTGQPSTIEIPTLQTAAQVPTDGGQDWGARYIDVDLTAQHAIMYDENGAVIWQADITTGQPSLGNATPTGVWAITNRKSRAVDGDINLKGPIDPATGEPEWDSHVDFWLGVVGNLIGFHNAPWQSVFGGQIYTWNGSHGCIRMSYADGQALYDVARVGDTVVIHN